MTATDSSPRLLDLWVPPDGAGRAVGCVTTTFTFDADFFEQQCLGRFLGLDTRPGEAAGDLAFLLEREQKLAETPVAVVADRSLSPDARSLRWDLLSVRGRTGVMHAKVTLLVWEHAVRFVVSSANLTPPSYRSSIELASVVEASEASEVTAGLCEELVQSVERLVSYAPAMEGGEGPRERALSTLRRARETLAGFDLRTSEPRGTPRMRVVFPDRDRDAIDGLMDVWQGGPPQHATVMSPFFDVGATASRAAERLADVLTKRGASVDVIVPVEKADERTIVRAPAALRDGLPGRIELALYDVRQPEKAEVRGLHGKLVLLESPSWVAALVGSSNFTAPGLGLGGGGNLEVGVAIGVRADSRDAKALRALVLRGDPVDPGATHEPEEDPNELEVAAPSGFLQVLGEPAPAPVLVFELDPDGLPKQWRVATADGHRILDSDTWNQDGRPIPVRVASPIDGIPANVLIHWPEAQSASLPVNVTDPGALPVPEELRDLPIDLVLRALASARPLHEALEPRPGQDHGEGQDGPPVDLDPHRRFSPAGQLMHRTRLLSAALVGLRDRLERPAVTLDALRWRLDGPFGPGEIAKGLARERTTIPGERAFLFAEIALTLSQVELAHVTRLISDRRDEAEGLLRASIETLAELAGQEHDGRTAVTGYVDAAFEQARNA
ncbi:MAG: hypothetical protein ACR2MB_15820 [Acidimicrobiales bacterium]